MSLKLVIGATLVAAAVCVGVGHVRLTEPRAFFRLVLYSELSFSSLVRKRTQTPGLKSQFLRHQPLQYAHIVQ